MHKSPILTVAKSMENHDDWFKLRRSASREISASPLMKCVVVVRVFFYGCSTDGVDDYVHIGKYTILEAVRRYTLAVIDIFGSEYLRTPNDKDTERLLGESTK
jgi:hypothetical protein